MAESVFTDLAQKAFRAGITPRTDDSLQWFRNQVRGMGDSINRRKLLRDPELVQRNRARVGSMYMYFYDPKHRETLPYYDVFPLTVMVQPVQGGFHGLNLHYLPPVLRAKLFDNLLDITNNKRYDDSTRFKLTYNLLSSASKLKEFKPCYKHYLYSQIEGSVKMVQPPEWEIALFLPTEQFRKSKKSGVWADSRKIIRGR